MEKYLKDNLNFLSDMNMASLNNNTHYQLDVLSTPKYNDTQDELYDQLNNLYEKMRVLEEVTEYLKTTTQNKIAESSSLCESLLKEIEESRDVIKETAYYNIYVDIQPTAPTLDRDGVQIPTAMVYNNEVVTRFTTKRDIPYTFEAQPTKPVYKNNNGSLKDKVAYRSYYISDQAYKEGVTEKAVFTFKQSLPVNKIKAKIQGVKGLNFQLHNAKDAIYLKDLSWQDAIDANKASFEINTTTYKEKMFSCDMERLSPDALTILNNELYKEATGQNHKTQAEIETLLGLNKLRSDYESYLRQVEDWKARRQAVANQNAKNGYSDEVPTYTIAKMPSQLGANEKTVSGIINQTIDTTAILPSKEIIQKDGTTERIVYMYDYVDQIFPSYERYRFDFNDPNNERYFNA